MSEKSNEKFEEITKLMKEFETVTGLDFSVTQNDVDFERKVVDEADEHRAWINGSMSFSTYDRKKGNSILAKIENLALE